MWGAREAGRIWDQLAEASAEALPRRCLCCRRPIAARTAGTRDLCPRCLRGLDGDGIPLRGDGIDGGFAATAYEDVARSLVAALKFSRLLVAADVCSRLMLERAPTTLLAGTIVPVPASPMRVLTRGFDPAEEIAARLARSTGLPCDPLVLRRRDLRRQRGRDRRSRLARPPTVRAAGELGGETLLIDDVSTTGATLDACARALRGAGATRVRALVFATVPPRSRKIR